MSENEIDKWLDNSLDKSEIITPENIKEFDEDDEFRIDLFNYDNGLTRSEFLEIFGFDFYTEEQESYAQDDEWESLIELIRAARAARKIQQQGE